MKIPAPIAAPLFLAAGVATLMAADLPGLRPDGSVLLPNQWSLRPAGKQIPLGDFPVNIAVHPGGRFAAVLHSGHGRHEIMVVDVGGFAAKTESGHGRHDLTVWQPIESKVVARVPVRESFYGLTFSPDGRRLFCSGAGDEVIHVFDFDQGRLTAQPDIPLRAANVRGIPCGLAVTRDGLELFAANVWGQTVSRVDIAARTNRADLLFMAPGQTVEKIVDTNQPGQTNRALPWWI